MSGPWDEKHLLSSPRRAATCPSLRAARCRAAVLRRRARRPPVEPRQYTSVHLTEHLALEGIRPSIGSVGDPYGNDLMETINGRYKAECIRTTVFHDGPYRTIADVEFATASWVD